MFNFVIGKRLVNVFLKGSKMSVFQAFLPHFHAKSKGYKIHSTASSPTSGAIPVIMATRIHLFPFRTQKLSSSTAKVLSHPRLGRIASCRISKKRNRNESCGCVFFCNLLSDKGGRTRHFIGQWTPTVRAEVR